MRIVAGKYSDIDLLDLDPLAKHHFNVAIKHFKAMAKCGMLKKPVAEYFVRIFYGDYMSYKKMYTIKNKINISYVNLGGLFSASTRRILRLPNDTSYICIISDSDTSRGVEFRFIETALKRAFTVRLIPHVHDDGDNLINEFTLD